MTFWVRSREPGRCPAPGFFPNQLERPMTKSGLIETRGGTDAAHLEEGHGDRRQHDLRFDDGCTEGRANGSRSAASAASRSRSGKRAKGRNPKTGEEVHIPAKRTPFFKVGKELKEMVDASEGAASDGPKTATDDPVSIERGSPMTIAFADCWVWRSCFGGCSSRSPSQFTSANELPTAVEGRSCYETLRHSPLWWRCSG